MVFSFFRLKQRLIWRWRSLEDILCFSVSQKCLVFGLPSDIEIRGIQLALILVLLNNHLWCVPFVICWLPFWMPSILKFYSFFFIQTTPPRVYLLIPFILGPSSLMPNCKSLKIKSHDVTIIFFKILDGRSIRFFTSYWKSIWWRPNGMGRTDSLCFYWDHFEPCWHK